MAPLKVMRLHPDATIPTRAKPRDSGLDLYAYLPDAPVIVRAGDRLKIDTGIAIELPDDLDVKPLGCAFEFVRLTFEAQVRPRSGMGIAHGVQAAWGTVDNGYRGTIGVTLFNQSFRDYTVRHGERIAQLVVAPVICPAVVAVTELAPSERGASGFGSTGV